MSSTFPANDLERALQRAADGDLPVGDWLTSLAESTVLAPTTSVSGGGASFPVLTFDGASYVAVFTSEDELRRAHPDASYVAAPFRDLVRQLPAHLGAAVNPGGTLGLPVPAAELQRLLGGVGTVPAGATLRVGEPAEEPVALLDRVAARLAEVPEVREARRCWAAVEDAEPGVVIGLVVDRDGPETREAALAAVRRGAAEATYAASVDVVFASDGDALSGWMQQHVDPFHRGEPRPA